MKHYLDNIVQLKFSFINEGYNGETNCQKDCQKRDGLRKKARSKYFSNGLAVSLGQLQHSSLLKSYWNTFYCCGALEQKEDILTGKYCNARWCLTCNRIRTAKMINGYQQSITELTRPYFLTLTVPNVKGHELREKIMEMIKAQRIIKQKLLKLGVDITGIRKLECTYNQQKDNYHPHFHFIISKKINAKLLLNEWLNYFPECTRSAQDVRKGNEYSTMELFKYFTKLVTKTKKNNSVYKKINIKSLDIIFNAMYNLRVFQPMGIVKNQKEYDRFINQIKNTYSPRKKSVSLNLINEENKRVDIVFTAKRRVNWKKSELQDEWKENEFYPGTYVEPIYPDREKELNFDFSFVGVNMPDEFKGATKGFNTFNKHEALLWFETFYKKLNGINITEDIDELIRQKIVDIDKNKTRWMWDKNDWFDVQTGELLTNYNPSDRWKEIIEDIDTYKTDFKEKKETSLKFNHSFLIEKEC